MVVVLVVMATLMSCKLELAVFVLDPRKLADAVVDASSQIKRCLLITIYYYFISMLFICVFHRIRLPYTTDYQQAILKRYTNMYLCNIPLHQYTIYLFKTPFQYITSIYLLRYTSYTSIYILFILQYLFNIPVHPNIPQYSHRHTSPSTFNIPLQYTLYLNLNVLQYNSNTSI